ncbi:MAG: c-type cytochrome, partial [bacterium]
MPQVFHKVNTSSPYHRELSTVVIDSITTFLFERSKPIDLTEPPAAPGDPERGEVLVKETGCMGCHSMEDEGITNSTQAPDLSNVGEKVNRKWLYNWLKNPEAIWPETHMPSMKLTDKEANDITAYLMDQTAEDWEASNFPTELAGDTPLKTVVDNRLEEMAKKFLGQTRGPIATQKKLKEIKQSSSNSKRALKLYVGEQAVTHFGCASCHAIPGYEGKNRIGAELTGWPNKSIHKLAYNYVDIPHTRQDYIMKKLENTGIFDQGLDKSYLAKYRMPKFNLNDKERKKIVTHVMSLKESNRVSPKLQFKQNSSDLIA